MAKTNNRRNLSDKCQVLLSHEECDQEGSSMPHSSNSFAFIIAKELMSKHDGNFVFSPAGLCSILEILQNGMDFSCDISDRINEIISGYYSQVESIVDEHFKLAHAISIWYDEKMGKIKKVYLDVINNQYKAEAHNADFTQPTKTKAMIDEWVSDKTHRMINCLDADISKDALMLVLDAMYMKAKWDNPFNMDCTEKDVFHNVDSSESEVDMMYHEFKAVEYSENNEYQVISLPYERYGNYMFVVLPKEGYDIDSIMSNSDWIEEPLEYHNVELYMPRFKYGNTLSYNKVLEDLGLGDIFNRDDSFPRISDLPAHISEIKQQCVISVEEEGAKAAAVTMAQVVMGCLPQDDMAQQIRMKINRPFGFAIKGENNQLLFMGIVKEMRMNQA